MLLPAEAKPSREFPRLCLGGSSRLAFTGVHPGDSDCEPPKHAIGESEMDKYQRLCHSQWECLYHVVFIPKRRRLVLYKELRIHVVEVFRRLAEQKESRVEEGHLMPDHVHMMLRITPKLAVSQVVGYIKGKPD